MRNLKEEEEESSSTLVMPTEQQLQGLALSVLTEPHSRGGPRTKKRCCINLRGGKEGLCCPATSLVVLALLLKKTPIL